MNIFRSINAAFLTTTIITLAFTAVARGDPLPGRDVLKFTQQPMVVTPIADSTGQVTDYFGHDELSTAYSQFDPTSGQLFAYAGQFMADDFADRFDEPVVHVRWWGSYLRDQIFQPVDKFLISFESDVPAGPDNPFSHPGVPLLNQVVTLGPLSPGSGTYTERLIRGPDPILSESLYEYNAELHLGKEFRQEPDTVYWLKIVALVDVEPDTPLDLRTQWGWHNRDYTIMDPLASVSPNVVPGEHVQGFLPDGTPIWHFQDDAVSGLVGIVVNGPGGLLMPDVFQEVLGPQHYLDGIDGPEGIGQFSKDLAFELYTVPEPASLALLGCGALLLLSRRRN